MTEEEINTAIDVTGGSSDGGKQLPLLLENTQATGIKIEEVLADTAYSGSTNLKLLQELDIVATIPLNPSVYSSRNPEDGFMYVKNADAVQCPAGHLSVRKARQGKKNVGTNQVLTDFFDVEKCQTCPLRDGCYNPGAKTKTYSIRLISKHHELQMEYEQTTLFQLGKRRRSNIEHKNAKLKIHHGMIRARYRGLFGMKIQAYLTAVAVNAKRMTRLKERERLAS